MIFADFHIHSKYSRATSKNLNLQNLEKNARIKGLHLLGTGDFTHPLWLKELKDNLYEEGGILKTKTNFKFVLQTEVSLVFNDNNKVRKIHLVLLAPSFDIVDQINEALSKYGNLKEDGRPTLNLDLPSFVEIIKEINEKIEIIPAHIWTPWFGVFGSKTGFDSIEEAFKDKASKIYALETGLSSDPPMNWRLSSLDRFNLVSNSDAHSAYPWRIGREANMFDIDEEKLTYNRLIRAIRYGEHLIGTIEVDPSYGKYHYDGHRKCGISLSPKEAMKYNNICPVCGKPLTIGVLHRVESLADRPEGYKPKNAKEFKRLLPLMELISHYYRISMGSKKAWQIYENLIMHFGNENNILLSVPFEELSKVVDVKFAKLIILNREQKLKVRPGYDGVYGELILDLNRDESENTAHENNKRASINTILKNTSLKDFLNKS